MFQQIEHGRVEEVKSEDRATVYQFTASDTGLNVIAEPILVQILYHLTVLTDVCR
jgi:hypothetical protein